MKLSAGQSFPPAALKNIHGRPVSIPDTSGRLTHLQFRRFAGCPVCNLHLQTFIQRHAELTNAGISEVVAFHSSDEELLPYQGRFPFDVIGDPEKRLYRHYGVETSIWAILNPKGWPAAFKAKRAKDNPVLNGMPKWGILGLPADFLIASDGMIQDAHYGKYGYDQWSVDEVLEKAVSSRRNTGKSVVGGHAGT